MTKIEHLSDSVTLYLGDCRDVLPTIGTVDALITSPPYAQQRDYGAPITDWAALVRVLSTTPAHEQTQILVNLGLIHKDGEVVEYWEPFKRDMRAAGWRFFAWYVWDKGFGAPGDWAGRMAPAHEFVFHFNRAATALQKWVLTQERKASGTGLRRADGSMSGISSPESAGQPYKVPDSVIRIPPQQARGGIESGHPAVYPVDFARHLVLTFSDVGQTVCDPFLGSGTTGVAAVKTGRAFVGIEIEPKYFDIARVRIGDALKQPDMFIKRPAREKPAELQLTTGRP